MEIEAKYFVPNSAFARKLRALERVNGFSLSTPTRLRVRDTFFDTRTNDLLQVRYVLRIRQRSDGKLFITLKQPTIRQDAIHRRPETEQELHIQKTPRVLHLSELPPRIKKLVAPIARSDSLVPLFSISQTRQIRMLRQGRAVIAEWSLDHVRFRAGRRTRAFYELEIELKNKGTEKDLAKLTAWLEQEYQLQPAVESKFARALEFTRGT